MAEIVACLAEECGKGWKAVCSHNRLQVQAIPKMSMSVVFKIEWNSHVLALKQELLSDGAYRCLFDSSVKKGC